MTRARPNKLLTIRPGHRETLPSFFARFAAKKGVAASDFAYDMGISFKRVVNQETAAISTLADFARLSGDEVADLLSWIGVRAGNVRMEYRGDTVVSRAARHPTMRGCPLCLRENAKADPADPVSCMVMRGDWQFRSVSICLRHARAVIPPDLKGMRK